MALDTYTGLQAVIADYLKRGDLTTQIPDFIYLAEKGIERKLNFGPSATQEYTSSAALTASQKYFYAPAGCIEPVYMSLETDPIRELEVVGLRELHRLGQANTSGIPQAMAQVGNQRSGSITAVGDAGGGDVDFTSTAHGLVSGEKVTVYGCTDTNYNGTFTITDVDDANTFAVTTTWGATDTGTWKNFQPRLMFDEAPGAAYDYTLFYKAKFNYLADDEVTWLLYEYPDLILYGTLVQASPHIKDDNRVPMWAGFYNDALQAAKTQQWHQRLSGGELRVKVDVAIP